MPIRLDTVLRKVEQMPNKVNSDLLKEFYQHMKDNGTSQNYQKGNLKAMIHFAEHIGAATSFFDIVHTQVLGFLDTKIKPEQIDPDHVISPCQIKAEFIFCILRCKSYT
jgi:hypothetical protein